MTISSIVRKVLVIGSVSLAVLIAIVVWQASIRRVTPSRGDNAEQAVLSRTDSSPLQFKTGDGSTAANTETKTDGGQPTVVIPSTPEVQLSPESEKRYMISAEKAVEIAQKAIKGKMKYDDAGKIRTELKDDQYVITFPFRPLGPTERGPDYAARVWVDARTGKVVKILGG